MNAPGDLNRGGCPVVHGTAYDPSSVEAAADPHPWLDLARKESPVFYVEKQDMWVVTRYEDVLTVLRDPETFSSAGANKFRPLTPKLKEVYTDGHPGQHSMLKKDPPEHTRIRKLVQKAFTPKVINRMEPQIRQISEDLIDSFIADGHCNYATQFAQELSIRTICEITGAPLDLSEDFAMWALDYFSLTEGAPELTPEREAEIAERGARILPWMRQFVDERREHPREDLTSALVHATSDDGDPTLSTDEVIAVLNGNLTAGTETTAALIPLLLRELLRGDGWQRVCADRSLLPNAIDEGLRVWAPGRMMLRVVTKETELAGVTLPVGAKVAPGFMSAGHDDAVFDHPEVFDLERENASKHLSFGRWTHMCIGAPVARLEARIGLETLADRIPNIELAPDQHEDWVPNMVTPRFMSLQLQWEPVASPTLAGNINSEEVGI
jgi:cytochrome P450